MSWHYQVRKHKDVWDKWEYTLVEYYKPQSWCAIPTTFESRKSLVENLEMMLHDAKKYPARILTH